MVFRTLSTSCLLLVSLLSAIAFAGYVEVKDTISFHWSAGAFDRLLLGVAYGGIAILCVSALFRVFAARQMLSITLAACIASILYFLATYPSNHDDAHAAPALSPTQMELYWLLAANGMLLLAACLAPWISNRLRKNKAR
ncbi:hypothetical protein [Noviherbaspirillum aerium]|uniref:hypothetical protein n=1 Tax=Noviherbaspirillum aerium TaxID=2588497 RepID=UPI00124F3260|nr:hypothetical protein [Noviherbaspirillum aerium]